MSRDLEELAQVSLHQAARVLIPLMQAKLIGNGLGFFYIGIRNYVSDNVLCE